MGNFIDLTGEKYGRLTVIKLEKTIRNKQGNRVFYWECQCDCGNIVTVIGGNLRKGYTKSCGCLRKEQSRNLNTTHGHSKTKLYHIWQGMKERCYCKTHKYYKNYGGRGITVFDEWLHDYQTFYDWAMQNGYRDGLTLDRENNGGNYEPSNCRWITQKEQCNNRRNNIMITYNDETQTLIQFCEKYGLNYKRTHQRLFRYGWTIEKAIGAQ